MTKRTYWLPWIPTCLVSCLCCAGNLTFPHCLHLPSCLRRCTQWCRTKFCKQGQKDVLQEALAPCTQSISSSPCTHIPSMWNWLTDPKEKAPSANRLIPGAKCAASTSGNLKTHQNCRRNKDKVVFSLSTLEWGQNYFLSIQGFKCLILYFRYC